MKDGINKKLLDNAHEQRLKEDEEIKEQLLLKIEGTSEWRLSKAEEYPDDTRNKVSADCLLALHEYLKDMPADADIFLMYRKIDPFNQGQDFEIDLSRYGFDDPDELPEDFCDHMVQKYYPGK